MTSNYPTGNENQRSRRPKWDILETMSKEIDLVGIKVLTKDWESTPESIKLVLMGVIKSESQLVKKG
jgi:hypothetical protein